MRIIGEYRRVRGETQLLTRRITAGEEAELEMLRIDEITPQPTERDMLEAQVLYTALITDTLLGEE